MPFCLTFSKRREKDGWNIVTSRVQVVTGPFLGTKVLLPWLTITPSDVEDYPFTLKRRQFPVRPAYAMTINKAQGQTFEKVAFTFTGKSSLMANGTWVFRGQVNRRLQPLLPPMPSRTKTVVFMCVMSCIKMPYYQYNVLKTKTSFIYLLLTCNLNNANSNDCSASAASQSSQTSLGGKKTTFLCTCVLPSYGQQGYVCISDYGSGHDRSKKEPKNIIQLLSLVLTLFP